VPPRDVSNMACHPLTSLRYECDKIKGEPKLVFRRAKHLTVRFLLASACTTTAKLLCLTVARIGNKKRAVELHKNILNLLLLLLINICVYTQCDMCKRKK